MHSMVRKKIKRGIMLAVWVASFFLWAPLRADDQGGGTASPFALGAGGRSIGMGGAKAAVWGGSYALLWNPAGLHQLQRGEVNLFHTPLFDASCSYSSLLASYPFIDMGVISLGMLRLDIGGIERRDQQNILVDGELSNRQTRYVLGYAREVYKGLSGGVSMKLDRFTQGEYSANGIGLDVGFGFQPEINSQVMDGMALGLTFFNALEPKVKLAYEESGDAYGTRAGFAMWRSLNEGLSDRFLLALDINKTKYDDARTHIGCEYFVHQTFAARFGWDSGHPTFGFGFNLYSFRLDYAYRGSDLEDYNLFSLSYGFGPSKRHRLEKRKQLREEEIRREIEKETSRYEKGQIENSLSQARKAFENHRFKSAAAYYETVLLWDPENQEAKTGKLQAGGYLLVITADSLFEAGNYGEAMLRYRRGNEYLRAPEIDDRIKMCEEIIGQTANREQMIESMFARALELYAEREWVEAAAVFEQVLELAPDHAIARSYLVRAKARLEEDRARILRQAGLLAAKKQYGEALGLLGAGLEKYPGDRELKEKLAEITGLKDQFEIASASKTVKPKEEEIVPSGEEMEKLRAGYEKGVKFFKDGKFNRAVEEWEQVWRRFPRFKKIQDYLVKAYLYWGMELYTRHDYQEALEIWGRILKVDPDNAKAIRYIRKTREELSRLESVSG
ncbi:MAG: PorV/PorQ family protein [Candidatus Krumholzibacteriota bacterium]|nr:PorV/PorQ family protein [Candidatus Krumholzibacteriota bacterium]